MAPACKEVVSEEDAALQELIVWDGKGKATPGMDCVLHKGWMSQEELVDTETHHMVGCAWLWLVVLFIRSARLVATFISCLCYSTCAFS